MLMTLNHESTNLYVRVTGGTKVCQKTMEKEPKPKDYMQSQDVSNRVPIRKIHFGCQERCNPNLSIISPGDPFVKRVIF